MLSETTFKKILENGPEIVVFMLVDSVWTLIVSSTKGMDDVSLPKRVWESTIKDNFNAVAKTMNLIKSTVNYGVTEPLFEGVPTDQFWKWYRWWRTYLRSLSDEENKRLHLALINNEDVSSWRPQGEWKK